MNSTMVLETEAGHSHRLMVNIISAVYGIISLGFFSNVAVAVVVGNIFIRLGRHLPNRHMLVYVLALCIVDALVLGTLPMLITQIYLQRWIFGQTLCTVYWIIESINKTLSTFILTCLSFDRYLAVRFPQRCLHIRTVRGALYILFFCIVLAALLLMPVYLHAEVTYVPVDNDNGTVITTSTCAFVGQSSFTFTLFTVCYVVPFACMSCFYGSMLARLRHKSRKLGLRQGRVKRVTKKTLTLVVLYFVFWTPYWVMTLRSLVSDAISELSSPTDNEGIVDPSSASTVSSTTATILPHTTAGMQQEAKDDGDDALSAVSFAVMCVIHSGCFLNSAINPILYALLNRELRRQHFAAMNQNGPRSSIPVSAANGAGPGPGRSSVGGPTGGLSPAQLVPLILCSSTEGIQQVKWDETASTAPSSDRAFVKRRQHPFWKFWRKQSSALSSSTISGGGSESRRDFATIDSRTYSGLYSRLISIASFGRRTTVWSDSANSMGDLPNML